MKRLLATTNIINKTAKWLLEKPTCVGTDKGKMVTRWDERFEFECESDDTVFTTDNILEAVEWLYTDEDDSISLDMEDVEELIDKAEKRGKREALEIVKDYHRRKELFYKRELSEGKEEYENIIRMSGHKAAMVQIDRLFENENL